MSKTFNNKKKVVSTNISQTKKSNTIRIELAETLNINKFRRSKRYFMV